MAEVDRCFAAFDGPEIVGTAAAFTMPMTVPGAEIEIGFVTMVAVRPTHRRRGVNTALMRRQLDEAHERGEVVEVLHASEGGIYGRYGYGLATYGLSIEIETARSAFVRGSEPAGRASVGPARCGREVDPRRERGHAARSSGDGSAGRAAPRLHAVVTSTVPRRTSPSRSSCTRAADGVDGFAVYKVKHDWPQGWPRSVLTVRDLQAATPQAYADLWRYVLDVDLIERVDSWNRPADESLLHLLQEPRRLRATVVDNLWVRLVDLAGALRARRYAADGRLVLEVADPFGPWNEGRYALEASAGEATVTADTDAPADIACTVNEVAATYLGGITFRQLHRAGRIQERTDGALSRADAMFGWDPAPWSPYDY